MVSGTGAISKTVPSVCMREIGVEIGPSLYFDFTYGTNDPTFEHISRKDAKTQRRAKFLVEACKLR